MSTADPHPAPDDPTLPPLNDPIEEDEDSSGAPDVTSVGAHPAPLA